METVEVVIRIPKYRLDAIKWACKKMPPTENQDLADYVYRDIVNGTVLPKGHGDLKDYGAIKSDYIRKMSVFMSEEERMDLLCTIVDEAPTIIEADKEDDTDGKDNMP